MSASPQPEAACAQIAKVMREGGSMAWIEDMHDFATKHDIPTLHLRDTIGHLRGDPHR